MTVTEKIIIEMAAWLIIVGLFIFFARFYGKKLIRFVLMKLYELFILYPC